MPTTMRCNITSWCVKTPNVYSLASIRRTRGISNGLLLFGADAAIKAMIIIFKPTKV